MSRGPQDGCAVERGHVVSRVSARSLEVALSWCVTSRHAVAGTKPMGEDASPGGRGAA